MMMELDNHSSACFITLTYEDYYLPEYGSLVKSDLQKFFKRLRKNTGLHLRYYAVGEYGSKRGRPHYHAIIYGMPQDEHTALAISKAWPFGRIQVDPCNLNTIQYVAGYVLKKLFNTKEEQENDPRIKEFALMSRRPALGSAYLEKILPNVFVQNKYDVPSVLQFGNKSFPLDRTMRSKLQKLVMTEEEVEHIKKLKIELMQNELIDFLLEETGENFTALIKDDDLHPREVLKLEDEISRAFYSTEAHYKNLEKSRRLRRRNQRKGDF